MLKIAILSKGILHTPEFNTQIPKLGYYLIREQYNEILRQAFESSLDILGYSGKACILHDLEDLHAYSSSDDSYLSLWKIGNGLEKLFGRELAEMMIESVMVKMDKLYSLQRV